MDPEMQQKIKEMMNKNKEKQCEIEHSASGHHLDGVLPKQIMDEHHKEYNEYCKEKEQKEKSQPQKSSDG